MNDQHSIFQLILHAGPVVQFVILLLLGASLVSWTIIFRQRRLLREAHVAASRIGSALSATVQLMSGGWFCLARPTACEMPLEDVTRQTSPRCSS